MQCSVADCIKTAVARGWCSGHWHRWSKYGTPEGDGSPLPGPPKDAVSRFLEALDWADMWYHDGTVRTRCLVWVRSTTLGYGTFGVDGKLVRVHRWAYERWVGPIPSGLHLDHLCHNADPTCVNLGDDCPHRACVNPLHLEPVTNRENNSRGRSGSAINSRKTHCVHGHLFDEANTHIDKRGRRHCRMCSRLRRREYLKRSRQ